MQRAVAVFGGRDFAAHGLSYIAVAVARWRPFERAQRLDYGQNGKDGEFVGNDLAREAERLEDVDG